MRAKSIFMLSGTLAVAFYVIHIIIGGLLWKNYSHLQQPISDLTANGAPNRNLLLAFTSIYSALAVMFAISLSVIEGKKHHKLFFLGSISFITMHIVSASYGFFPEDLPNAQLTFSGKMHIIITALIVPFTILSPFLIGAGLIKEEKWKRFGYYSIITSILILIFGSTTALFYTYKLPYFGVIERLNISTLQIWTFCFSWKLFTSYK